MTTARPLAEIVLLTTLACAPAATHAWGADAHRLIAGRAEPQLTSEAKAEVDRLLSLEPGATLMSISTEADDIRTEATAPWHYVNVPRDVQCRYDASRDCAGGQCVVAAIDAQTRILRSSATDAERLSALKYVVHLVADVHQPLHAAFADDRGGNRYQLQVFDVGTNLHALWDAGMIEHWPGGLGRLRSDVARSRVSSHAADPTEWMAESCRIASSPGFYPEKRRLTEAYRMRWRNTVVARLALAADRLAVVLNANLVGPPRQRR